MGNRKQWKTKDGTKIKIKDMDDEHLLNSIRFLERKKVQKALAISSLPEPQGDMAQMAFEQETNILFGADTGDVFPIYNDMVEEAVRRKIWKFA